MSQRKPPDDDSARPAQGWGKTRPLDGDALGSALPTPHRPEPGDAFSRDEASEPAVRIARNVITGGNPAVGSDQAPRPAPRPQASPRPAQPVQSAKATLLLTDADPSARQVSGRAPARAEDRRPMSDNRQPNQDFAQHHAELPAQPRAPMQPQAKAAPPAGASARPASPKSARPPESTRPVPAHGSESEPLRLQLHEGDMLEQPVDIGPGQGGVPTRSSGLVVGLVVVLVIAAGAGVWYGMSSHGKTPAEPLPTQNEAQLAPTGTAQPTTPAAASPVPAQPPAQAAAPTAPTQPAQQPAAAAPSAVPAQAQAAQAPAAQPAEEPHAAEPSAASAPSKGAAHKPKRRGGGSAGPSAPGEASSDVAAAREALRSLESGPVMKLKPREEEPPSDDSAPLAPPEPPEPPPPAPE